MNPNLLKFLSVVLLFALWAALVFTGKTDPESLVAAIGAAVAGLGVHGATVHRDSIASAPAPDTPAPTPAPAPEPK